MKNIIIIPARLESSRLFGKPLIKAAGKSLLQHVYELAKKTIADKVYVVTSDLEVSCHCDHHGINHFHINEEFETGTHRCANLLKRYSSNLMRGVKTVVNLQVDEPEIHPNDINALFNPCADIRTLINSFTPYNASDPNEVKVFATWQKDSARLVQKCHWFYRDKVDVQRYKGSVFHHLGVYAYPKDVLLALGELEVTENAHQQSLEQLAWLDHGYTIRPVFTDHYCRSINTKEDFEAFKHNAEMRARRNEKAR